MSYDKGFIEEVLDFIAQGNSWFETAERFMISPSTIRLWVKKQKAEANNKNNHQESEEKDLINKSIT